MAHAARKKDQPLSLRLPKADLALIDRAAALRGSSRTDFMRETAVRAAEEIVLEACHVRMSAAGFKAFTAALSGPGTPVPALVEVARRKAPWET